MTVEYIEDQIRTTSQTNRIRPWEFFLDYDKLRSGYVTKTQFFRVLWENLNVKLNDEQQNLLAAKYDIDGEGRMNYKRFCNTITKPFDPNDLHSNPADQREQAKELLGTERSVRALPYDSESKIKSLLSKLKTYYNYRGINLRTSCEDFDRHHIGVINESQFYRSFPHPPEVAEEDIHLLVQKYGDPQRPGQMNYLNLHHDLENLSLGDNESQLPHQRIEKMTHMQGFSVVEPRAECTLEQLFDRMRVAVHKNRVRTIEFFKDYDKLRSGVITENQFVCGLSAAIGKEAQLSRPEIQKIVEFYRQPDERVRYKEFCDIMENAFNVPNLEKQPTMEVIRPPEGVLGRNLPPLTDAEEERIRVLIGQLSRDVRKRRLMMYQYFKDYDRSTGYSRVITPTQFGRILHFLSLNVAEQDFEILCKKFADPVTGDVNYPAFVQLVDQGELQSLTDKQLKHIMTEFVNYTQDPAESTSQVLMSPIVEEKKAALVAEDVDIASLMSRIRHIALVNRRRVLEYFHDFDPLRSGSITVSQFRRGLSDFGLSSLGQHNLNNVQFEALARYYQDPEHPDKVHWTRFRDDIEAVFTQPSLERHPSQAVIPQEKFLVPKPGTVDFNLATDDHKSFVSEIMDRLRQRANQRRVLAKPVFQDFDRHNNGHVTRGQFRQCMTLLDLNASEEEMKSLEAKFQNDTGFNYLSFLEELQPEAEVPLRYLQRLEELRITNNKAKLQDYDDVDTDLESILIKIKTKVYKERIRIYEWMRDYDKLRSGVIPKSNFRRALDLCTFGLAESEFAILEDHYASPANPESIQFLKFCDDIEAIFATKHLEKQPQLETTLFHPPEEWAQNHLSPDMEDMLMTCMQRLAERVRKNRVQLYPLFEDYDRVHNGTVSRTQFRRVISELELEWMIASEQEWELLYQKFAVKVGGKHDVNYCAFCDRIYELARME